MSGYKEIKSRIHKNYETLSKNHKQLADFMIENFDNIPFLSVQDISKSTSLSVASVVRFAQRIGFKGFLEMREEVADHLKSKIKNKQIFSLIDGSGLKEDTLISVAERDINNINESLNLIDRESFKKAVDLILKSERVFTSGLGISYLLAQILAYQLNQVAVNASNFTHNHSSFMEQILFLNSKDLIIALSFPPYSKETIEAVKFAKQKKIKILSLTNKDASPISFLSDVSLIIKSDNTLFTNSFAAISVLINAIATECALKNKSKANKMLNNINKIMELQDIVIA